MRAGQVRLAGKESYEQKAEVGSDQKAELSFDRENKVSSDRCIGS